MTYRVGKKQNRAVMDSEGNALVIFPKGKENLAQEYCDFLNSSNWIDVKDKMPDGGERVLAYGPELGILSLCLHLNIEGKWKYTGYDKPVHYSHKITHWMPLPEPPKNNNANTNI